MDWWVGVERADENLELGVDTLLLGSVFADDGECSDTLSVETLCLLEYYWIDRSESFPTMFLAKDWAKQMLWPSLMKWRMGKASLLVSPLAKPW
jgi:hypothetical protein